MSYNKKDITFIRFGDLNPIKQDGYKKDTFHSAPAPKGFYAFISFMIEPFLLGGYNPIGTKHSKRKYIKDSNGEKVIIGKIYEDKTKPPLDKYDDHFTWCIYLEEDEQERLRKQYNNQKNLFVTSGADKNGVIHLHTMKKPKKFKYTGEIWHHLGEHVPNNLILKRNKGWVLTDFITFVKAFNKELHEETKHQNKFWLWKHLEGGNKTKLYKNISKDHFEVFIERL